MQKARNVRAGRDERIKEERWERWWESGPMVAQLPTTAAVVVVVVKDIMMLYFQKKSDSFFAQSLYWRAPSPAKEGYGYGGGGGGRDTAVRSRDSLSWAGLYLSGCLRLRDG